MSDSAGLRCWCWTTFKTPVDLTQVTDSKHHRYTVYQLERCPDTGRIHAQGYSEFMRTMRMNLMKKLFQDQSIHLEPRQGTNVQARDYCMKEESRIEGPFEHGVFEEKRQGKRVDLVSAKKKIIEKRKLADLYQDDELTEIMAKYPRWAENVLRTKPLTINIDIELYEWQKSVIELLNQPPVKRRIIWIWSSQSGTGKTTFFDYCCSKYDVLPANGKFEDILYAYDENQIIWFDFSRAQNGYESYNSLEKLSNHSFHLSTKYLSTKKYICAHVVVTSNHAPDVQKLPDRFKTYHIDPIPTIV